MASVAASPPGALFAATTEDGTVTPMPLSLPSFMGGGAGSTGNDRSSSEETENHPPPSGKVAKAIANAKAKEETSDPSPLLRLPLVPHNVRRRGHPTASTNAERRSRRNCSTKLTAENLAALPSSAAMSLLPKTNAETRSRRNCSTKLTAENLAALPSSTTTPSVRSVWSTSTVRGGGGSRDKKLSLLTYNKLVGESDGGVELPEHQVQVLVQKYKDSWENRIYVTFCRASDGKQCFRIKPQSACYCGHAYRSHEWFAKSTGCRTPGCKCACFKYLQQSGAWRLRCTCKHLPEDHRGKDGIMKKCAKMGCACGQFKTSYACRCGVAYEAHETIVETADERRALGKPVDQDVCAARLRKVRQKRFNQMGCGRCVACKCGMSCKQGSKTPWHDPNSSTLAAAKAMANPFKKVSQKERGKKTEPSRCDCAVQGRVCKCTG